MREAAQGRRVVYVCSEASCVEEIDAYIRYQSSRDQDGKAVFGSDLAARIIADIGPVLTALPDTDKLRAWRLYAVFLARELTYFEAKRRDNENKKKHAQHSQGHAGDSRSHTGHGRGRR